MEIFEIQIKVRAFKKKDRLRCQHAMITNYAPLNVYK